MSRPANDRKLLLYFLGGAVALIAGIILLAPPAPENNPLPTVTNRGAQGAKAILLSLQKLGLDARAYDAPLADLKTLDAPHTALILAAPTYAATDEKSYAADVSQFLQRGGLVLATGAEGALLLPGGSTADPAKFQAGLCSTNPEGPGPIAASGPVDIYDYARWNGEDRSVLVDHRCNNDAVVVHFAYGAGEAIWWSSAHPLTNDGLKSDSNLRLLLASLSARGQTDARGQISGHLEARSHILFDEALHHPPPTRWDKVGNFPLGSLLLQLALLFLLLIVSFGRRNGPIRTLVTRPRTSPLEFAESMGTLYARGEATGAATDAARSRLHRTFRLEAGLAPAILAAGPEAIAAALTQRLGGDWSSLALDLQQAEEATHGTLNARSALALVRALHADEARLRSALKPTQNPPIVLTEEVPVSR